MSDWLKNFVFFATALIVLAIPFTMFYMQKRQTQRFVPFSELMKISELSKKASAAYLGADRARGISALLELLAEEEKARGMPGCTNLISEPIFSADIMLTHSRLARLYSITGQTNLSSQEIHEALACATTAGKAYITNDASLEQYVDMFDEALRKQAAAH